MRWYWFAQAEWSLEWKFIIWMHQRLLSLLLSILPRTIRSIHLNILSHHKANVNANRWIQRTPIWRGESTWTWQLIPDRLVMPSNIHRRDDVRRCVGFEPGVAPKMHLNRVPHSFADIGNRNIRWMHPLGVAMPAGIGRQLFALMFDFSANRVPNLAAAKVDVQCLSAITLMTKSLGWHSASKSMREEWLLSSK